MSSSNNKMKGLLKGLRYISEIFGMYFSLFKKKKKRGFSDWNDKMFELCVFAENEKEPEMQIGLPTDVKHVAHIGWDGPSSVNSAPSWVN